MALPDLTGINIENSYQRVVHTDGTLYYDGTGSLLNIGGTANTGSFATTGSNTFRGSQIISSSGVQVPLQVVSGSATLFHISSSNNVGFNQSASATTHVQFKSPYNSNIVEINTNANGQYGVRTDGIIKATNLYFYNTTGTIANASGVTLLGFNASNNIGVKTTTPTATLDVSGSVNISGSGTSTPFQVYSGSTPLLFVSGTGNTGIGTSAPAYTLDVNGIIQANGNRRILVDSANGLVSIKGSAGGWANYFGFLGSSNGVRGGFGALGAADALTYYYIGASHTAPTMVITSGSNLVGINTTSPTATLDVSGSARITNGLTVTGSTLLTNGQTTIRGSGATSATTAFLVQNSTPTNILTILDNGTVGIGRTPTQTLDIAGTTRMSGSFNTAASGSILTVQGSGSAQPIFTVLGSQGELFSITDSLSGSLFSVNDISGLPILEVFSDGTTLIGDYLDPMLITTKKSLLTNSGSFTIYSLPTASYDTAFFDYSVRSGSNARAGQIMAIQSGSSVNYTETTTTDFGTTTGLALGVFISGSNMVLTGSAATTAWTIKAVIRSL